MELSVYQAPITIRRVKRREIIDHKQDTTTIETDAIEVELRVPGLLKPLWSTISKANREIDRLSTKIANFLLKPIKAVPI